MRHPPFGRRRRPSPLALRAPAAVLGSGLRTAVAFAVLAVALTGVLAAGAAGQPGVDTIVSQPLPSDTLLYHRTGQVLLADLHPPGFRHYQQTFDGMATYLTEATVAIEDARFWKRSSATGTTGRIP